MNIADMIPGRRVRLAMAIDTDLVFVPAGLLGTVEHTGTESVGWCEGRDGEPGYESGVCCHVRLDERVAGLADWDNLVQVWVDPGLIDGGIGTPACFEAA